MSGMKAKGRKTKRERKGRKGSDGDQEQESEREERRDRRLPQYERTVNQPVQQERGARVSTGPDRRANTQQG